MDEVDAGPLSTSTSSQGRGMTLLDGRRMREDGSEVVVYDKYLPSSCRRIKETRKWCGIADFLST